MWEGRTANRPNMVRPPLSVHSFTQPLPWFRSVVHYKRTFLSFYLYRRASSGLLDRKSEEKEETHENSSQEVSCSFHFHLYALKTTLSTQFPVYLP